METGLGLPTLYPSVAISKRVIIQVSSPLNGYELAKQKVILPS